VDLLLGWLRRLFNANEREIRRLSGVVALINELEPEISRLSDEELRAKTGEFRQRLANGATLDDLLPEAFAVVREAARRTVGLRPFDVQLMGGVVLHEGRIAEMKTGEGKTLVAVLPAYLNALEGKGVHIVTVNDYLAKRDSQWMGQIYRFLGMSVGLIVHEFDAATRKRSYAADVTYGTNHEFGFDYLRDNMAFDLSEVVQRELNYAIVDEVDSILIDEARTPLIISDPVEKPTELYYRFAAIVEELVEGEDYTVDEKLQTVAPTEQGVHKVERMLGVENLYDVQNMNLSHYLENALKAKALMKRDERYIVKDGQVVIVDEFTGRLMFGRRWGHGLHEAVEAKEGCRIPQGTRTMATITYQNYFRLYRKLAGMTGTAATEEDEFHKIYKLDVVVIPTNKPMIRRDLPDVVYRTEAAKFRAVVREIKECHERGQPVLVGTVDIAKNERLSRLLEREGVPHQVLNAKHHEKEAQIIAQAGRLGAVTIATNMAGRGTDILLGGNPEYLARQQLVQEGVHPDVVALASEKVPPVLPGSGEDPVAAAALWGVRADLLQGKDPQAFVAEVAEVRRRYLELLRKYEEQCREEHDRVVALGGLHVIGTERHESRRIDNQLRGRSGRQGDPGSSRFYLSLEDSLMRLFGGDFLQRAMDFFKVDEDEPIESPLVTRAIEQAQRKVEARNFEARKHVLDYDDVLNQQREVIYAQRRRVLVEPDPHPIVLQMLEDVVARHVAAHCPENADPEDWDLRALLAAAERAFLPVGRLKPEDLAGLSDPAAIRTRLVEEAERSYAEREALIGREAMRQIERRLVLMVVNLQWIEHLEAMDELREGIGLRAYGQLDPLTQYKLEAYEMFEEMVQNIRAEAVRLVYLTRFVRVVQGSEDGQAGGLPSAEVSVAAGTAPTPAAPPAAGGPRADPAPAPVIPLPRIPAGARLPTGPGGPRAQGGQAAPRGGRPRRNDPCPCGSGKKYKHCCGR
jgi:preprotein translocase subunit SecA